MTDKPKHQTPFSPGGSHYKPPRGGGASGYVEKPARGEPATGSAGDKRPFSAEHQAAPEAKAAGHAVAAEVRAKIAEKKHALADKLLHLAEHATNEQVQLAAINSALDRVMGKPAQAVTGENGTGPVQMVVAWEGDDC